MDGLPTDRALRVVRGYRNRREHIDALKARVGLADLISRHVELRRRGREYVGLCPFHAEQTPSFTVSEPKGFFHCFGCGAHGDVIAFVGHFHGLGFADALVHLESDTWVARPHPPNTSPAAATKASPTAAEMRCWAAEIWRRAQLLSTGDPAHLYLTGRGLRVEPSNRGAALRFHPSLKHPETQRCHPAMVAAVRDVGGNLIAVQRTYLERDAAGAWHKLSGVEDAKLSVSSCRGGAVQLSPPDYAREPHLGLAEGVETGLSCEQMFGIPVWVPLAVTGLLTVELSFGVSDVIVFADRMSDPLVETQLAKGVRRLRATGRRVAVWRPIECLAPGNGGDFNDVLEGIRRSR